MLYWIEPVEFCDIDRLTLRLLLQVKTDFRKVLKKMMPDEHVSAHTHFSSYINNEGVFGDPELMTLTEDGHKNQIPTYQFWNQEGKTTESVQMHETLE